MTSIQLPNNADIFTIWTCMMNKCLLFWTTFKIITIHQYWALLSHLISDANFVGVALNLDSVARGSFVGDPLKLRCPGHDPQVLDVGAGHVFGLHDWTHPDLVTSVQCDLEVTDPALGVVVQVPVPGNRTPFGLDQRASRQTIVPVGLKKQWRKTMDYTQRNRGFKVVIYQQLLGAIATNPTQFSLQETLYGCHWRMDILLVIIINVPGVVNILLFQEILFLSGKTLIAKGESNLPKAAHCNAI